MAAWDIAIVGGGAAGLSAAATAARAGLTTLLIDRMGGGGELMNLGPLHDHGPDETGPDLAARLLEDAIAAGAELSVADVTALTQTQSGWRIATGDGIHDARAVILAGGLGHGTLGLANEQDFEGMGLSHCAACDGPLFRDQPVIVAGADRWAQQEARDLATIASQVTLIAQGAPIPLIDGVTAVLGHIVELTGENGLDSVRVQPDNGGKPQRIEAQGVFVQTGRRPDIGFAPDTLSRDSDGRVIANDTLATNLPNLFAAGDARAGSRRTLAGALDDGRRATAAAGLSLGRYTASSSPSPS